MKSIILSIAAAFAAAAAAGEKAYLWPEGKMPDAQPHQYAAMTDVSLAKGFKADEWRAPYIEWFEPEPGVERSASPGTGSYTWMDRIWEFMSAKGFNK